MERLKQQLQAEGIAYRADEPLAAHCTFKIGGPADVFALPETEEQLCRVIALCKEQGVKYYLLGNGSNILFEDAGYRGVVIDTMALKMGIGFLEQVAHPGAAPGEVYDAVVAGAGLKLSSLCTAALENSLTGLEFAYGIPGTVGGAVYMNAGAYGGEMKDVLQSVRYLTQDGDIVEAETAALDLSYRHSIFEENGGCILSAQFHLKRGDPDAIKARMNELMAKRVEKQPLDKPSAGSTFKRPAGLPPRRRGRQRKALRLRGESGRRDLRRCAGSVRRGAGHREGKDRVRPGKRDSCRESIRGKRNGSADRKRAFRRRKVCGYECAGRYRLFLHRQCPGGTAAEHHRILQSR